VQSIAVAPGCILVAGGNFLTPYIPLVQIPKRPFLKQLRRE
jgi:hypothetical protein